MTIGILAYGSLLANPGEEIMQATERTISGVETPFAVEYARKSGGRSDAPTLVPVSDQIGNRVHASIFVLKAEVTEKQARDILYRRELNKVGTDRQYRESEKVNDNTVLIKELVDFSDVTKVLYTSIAATIPEILDASRSIEEKADVLARLAIASVTAETYAQGRDGIRYLSDAIEYGVETQLTNAYRQNILRLSGSSLNLEDARIRVAKQKNAAPPEQGITGMPSHVYRVSQGQFNVIPGKPWTYWIHDSIRDAFVQLPPLGDLHDARRGLSSGDNARFYRFWWEIGTSRVSYRFLAKNTAQSSSVKWCPLMKGGQAMRWYGNQEHVVDWSNNGKGIRSLSHLGARPQNEVFYFREGVTWSSLTSLSLSVRYMPPGFIFSDKGDSAFSDTPTFLLAFLNSSLASYLVRLISGTVDLTCGTVAKLPIVTASDAINQSVHACVRIAKGNNALSEVTFDFAAPPRWDTGLQDFAASQARLAAFEAQIDDEVYRLYGISAEDRAAIEAEVGGQRTAAPNGLADSDNAEASDEQAVAADADDEAESPSLVTRQELAVRWVSYAVGIIVGRFQPGVAGALGSAVYRREDFAIGSLPMPDEVEFDQLVGAVDRFAYVDANGGRHVFSTEAEAQLRALADKDGIVVLDEGHPDDLPAKVETALEVMLGEQGTAEIVIAIGGQPPAVRQELRRFLERDFFSKWHVKWYRKRPIYWLLQSPKKLYGLYIFHERIAKDTLFVVQRRKYLEGKIIRTQQLLAEAHTNAEQAASARDRRSLNKAADDLEKLLADLDEFAKRLKAITDRGYDPDIDDGVILNLTPLADVIPAWSKEPQKYWAGLEAGDYDWAHLAMKYWPDRVKQKCKTDKSLAIAHGVG